MWPAHEGHARVQHWFAKNAESGWATCPVTQMAVIRILSNPAFSKDAVTPRQALNVLETNLHHPFHRFWEAGISLTEAVKPFQKRLIGHQQVTDAYLLGLALHKRARLATMDRAVRSLLSHTNIDAGTVNVI
jgi:toxin-antitoxin system PIN domain toxin